MYIGISLRSKTTILYTHLTIENYYRHYKYFDSFSLYTNRNVKPFIIYFLFSIEVSFPDQIEHFNIEKYITLTMT